MVGVFGAAAVFEMRFCFAFPFLCHYCCRCCAFVTLLQHEAWSNVPKVAPTHAAARLVRVSDDMHLRHVALTNARVHYEMSYA